MTDESDAKRLVSEGAVLFSEPYQVKSGELFHQGIRDAVLLCRARLRTKR